MACNMGVTSTGDPSGTTEGKAETGGAEDDGTGGVAVGAGTGAGTCTGWVDGDGNADGSDGLTCCCCTWICCGGGVASDVRCDVGLLAQA